MSDGGWEQRAELSLLKRFVTDDASFTKCQPILSGYAWIVPQHEWVWEQLTSTREQTNESAGITTLRIMASGLAPDVEETISETLDRLEAIEAEPKPRALSTALLHRSNERKTMAAIERASAKIATGEVEAGLNVLRKSVQSISVAGKRRPKVEPLIPRSLDKIPKKIRIPTGLYEFDRRAGGIGVPEFAVIFGRTNVGKSAISTTLGHGGIRANANVLHIDTENGKEVVIARYISRFTGVPHEFIESQTFGPEMRERVETWLERHHERLSNKLRVIYLGNKQSTFEDLVAAWDEATEDGWSPDVALFDSPDHVILPGGANRWEDVIDLYDKLDGLTKEKRVGMWASTQANILKSDGKIATLSMGTDSQHKFQVAQMVVSINKMPGAAEDAPGRLLYVAKNRNKVAGYLIEVETDLARMLMKAPPIGASAL